MISFSWLQLNTFETVIFIVIFAVIPFLIGLTIFLFLIDMILKLYSKRNNKNFSLYNAINNRVIKRILFYITGLITLTACGFSIYYGLIDN